MKRRNLLALGAGALAAPWIAHAQAKYPERTMRLVVPFAPAGPTDIIGRMVAEKMTGLLGQTMIVDNKAGAAGSIRALKIKNPKTHGPFPLFATSPTPPLQSTASLRPPYATSKDLTTPFP